MHHVLDSYSDEIASVIELTVWKTVSPIHHIDN